MNKFWISLYIITLIVFGVAAWFAHQLPYFLYDIGTGEWLQQVALPFFREIMHAVSRIGSGIPAAVIVALVVAGLWIRGRRLEPILIISLASLSAIFSWLLKLVIGRPRPNSELLMIVDGGNGLSFPSGHVLYAVALYGFLLYLASKMVKQPLIAGAFRSLMVLLVLLTGISRINIGAHWLSDVLGGFLVGLLLLAPAITIHRTFSASSDAGNHAGHNSRAGLFVRRF